MAGTTRRNAPNALAAAARGEAVAVTSRNFEALLLASAGEAAAVARGERTPARSYTLERTDRDTEVAPPPRFAKSDVQALRRRLAMSQAVFAKLVGVSLKLEQAWETGARAPSGAAARVLQVLAESPHVLTKHAVARRAPIKGGSVKRASAKRAVAKRSA